MIQSAIWKTCLCKLLMLLPLSCLAASVESLNRDDHSEWPFSFTTMVVGIIASVVVTALVLILIVANCMDCMNSEVSSESHPACSDSGQRKWGGALDYTPADRNNPSAGYTTGEVINPSELQNQPLPYSMVPTQVPEEAGFRGYQPVEGGGVGLSGYTAASYNAYQSSGFGRQTSTTSASFGSGGAVPAAPNRHRNPMEPEEPPPAYGATHY